MKPDFQPAVNSPHKEVDPGREREGAGKPRLYAALFLALLAPALGGGTSPPAVTVLLMGIGLVAVILPAKKIPHGFLVGALLLLIGTMGWLWPAQWNALPWREELDAAGISLGWTTSPEPWISLRAWLLLFAALVWMGWCLGQPWRRRDRRRIIEGLGVGIGGIALLALIGRGSRVPGWPAGTGLGPFANRNQTALLFAVGAFLAVVSAMHGFAKNARRKPLFRVIASTIGWLCLLIIYTAALGLNRSRSGPFLFGGMTLLWTLGMMPRWRQKPKMPALATAFVLLLGAVFLMTGGGVINRLATTHGPDFRLKIYADTLSLIRASPWTGTGLGCFEPLFPLYRNASIIQERVLHPESDWLWLTAEAGLPGLLAVAGFVAWMAARAWNRLIRREDRGLQLALCVACFGVLGHSLIDVPGHRLGTLMPALLLLGLAAGSAAETEDRAGWLVRGPGALVLAMGIAAFCLLGTETPMPLVNGVEMLTDRAMQVEGGPWNDPGRNQELIAKAIRWAPLDWILYVERADMEGLTGKFTAALSDFRRARILEPSYARLPAAEGSYWLNVAPRFAIEPWREALRRMPLDDRPELYQQMLMAAYPRHPELHSALATLAETDPGLELVYFGWASPDEFQTRLHELLGNDPALSEFTANDLRRLFEIWQRKGNAGELVPLLAAHPAWMNAGYRELAEYDAASGNFPSAAAIIQQYLPKPQLPAAPSISHAEAARRFELNHGDFAAGMALYFEAIAAGRESDAAETLQAMSATPGCPGYVHYLAGQLLLKTGRPSDAWKEFDQCPE